MPGNLAGLPEYFEPYADAADDTKIVEHQDNSSSENDGTLPDPPDCMEDVAHTDDQPERRRERGQIPPVATHCGTLPAGSALEDFHQPLARIHARNAEGRYWQNFSTRVQQTFPSPPQDISPAAAETSWRISNGIFQKR